MLARYYRKKGFVVACQDEATFGLIPWIVRGWAKRGSRPTAIQNFQHKCTSVFGARTIRTFVFSFARRNNQRAFVAFLEKLRRRWGAVCLFVDNAPWHKGAKVERYLESHRQTFRLFRFLKHCPELNPVEPCWKPARKVLGNRLNVSIESMKYHLRKVFSDPFLMPNMFKYISD